MICPTHIGAFEFVVLASLRTAQLTRGCAPRMPTIHKHTVTAQCEVAAGLVTNAGLQSSERRTPGKQADHAESAGTYGSFAGPLRVPDGDRGSAPTLTSSRPEATPLV
jgi:hypothetical protein